MSDQVGTAQLTATANSHEFLERKIALVRNSEPTKIGRAVAKLRPLSNNAIFDCKVLSRNHAVIWYEDDKFYLKDTKSSNGTYVNNERLSKGGEESPPREIFSGDIVQLGVDIIESQKKATFNCIIAMIKLSHPDGREVNKPESDIEPATEGSGQGQSHIVANIPPGGQYVSPSQMFQLMQYLREANHKKEILEDKFANLEKLVEDAQNKTSEAFRSCITEDQLLSRIENLETQLDYYKRNVTADRMRNDLERMLEEKDVYENKCKKRVQTAITEKNEAIRQQNDLENSLQSAELKNKHLEDDLSAIRRHCEHLDELTQQLDTEKRNLLDSMQTITKENGDLKRRIDLVEEEKQKIVTDFETMKAAITPERLKELAVEYKSDVHQAPSTGQVFTVKSTEEAAAVYSGASLGAENPTTSSKNETNFDDPSPTEELVRLEEELHASKVKVRTKENELKNAKEELNSLQQTVKKNSSERDEMETRIKRAEALLADKCRQLESMQLQYTDEKNERANLQDEVTKLKDELDVAWRKIDASCQETHTLRDQIHSLTQKCEIQQQTRATPPRESPAAEIEAQLEKMYADTARYKADFAAMSDAKDKLEKEKTIIETEVSKLREESTNARNELRRANDALTETQRQLTVQTSASNLQSDDLQKCQIVNENLQVKITSLTAELARTKEQQSKVESELFELQTRDEANCDGGAFWQATQQLRDMANWTFWSSAIPLSILLLSIIMAFRPFLASFTATVDTANDPDQPPAETNSE